jgi:hypothetical protein
VIAWRLNGRRVPGKRSRKFVVAVAEGIDGPWVVPNLAGGIQLRCIRLVTLSGFGALRKDTEG